MQQGDLEQPMEDEHDALPAIKRFIASDNKEQVFVAICLNQGVRECICQLAVHEKIAIEDRKHYINLLLAYESRSASDVHTAYLSMYQLEIIGQMLMSQQKLFAEREEKLQEKITLLEEKHEMDQQELQGIKKDLSQVLSILTEMQQKENTTINESTPSRSSLKEPSPQRNRLFSSSSPNPANKTNKTQTIVPRPDNSDDDTDLMSSFCTIEY